jgi:DNA-3-methyladenine glycosylase II
LRTGEQISIPLTAGFDFRETRWFLDRNLDDCMHTVKGEEVRKLVLHNGKPLLLGIHESGGSLIVRALAGKITRPAAVVDFISEWFDLHRDLKPFYRLLRRDHDLAFLAKDFRGFHMVGIPELFETLCWCIIGQQINLEFAYRVKRRLVEKFGAAVYHEGEPCFLFPEPDVIAATDIAALRSLQLTTRKAEYITGVARLFADGKISRERLAALGDEQLMTAELMRIRGIGEWTANYTLMKSLRAMDRVPYGDAGINIALNRYKSIPKKNNRAEVEAVFDRFPGWKTYLVYYLWRSLRQMA